MICHIWITHNILYLDEFYLRWLGNKCNVDRESGIDSFDVKLIYKIIIKIIKSRIFHFQLQGNWFEIGHHLK